MWAHGKVSVGFVLSGGVVMGRLVRLVMTLGCVVAGVSAVVADDGDGRPPTTMPSTQPVSPGRLADVRSMLVGLASEDSEKREEARLELLGLQRSDLATLREAIRLTMPLEPSQRAVLRDIVTHVYLVGDTYSSMGDGFLGVMLPNSLWPDQRAMLSLERGVAVMSRLPGYCAFRMLQDGDVIIGLAGQPDVEFNNPEQLTAAVKGTRAGQPITFDVIRQGRIVKVPIRLDRRPTGIDRDGTFTEQRAQAADELWERDFAPLLAGEKVSWAADSRLRWSN